MGARHKSVEIYRADEPSRPTSKVTHTTIEMMIKTLFIQTNDDLSSQVFGLPDKTHNAKSGHKRNIVGMVKPETVRRLHHKFVVENHEGTT